MISRDKWTKLGVCATATAAMISFSSGCGSKDPEPITYVAPAPQLPPPPEAPSVTPIEQLINELNIDRRVILPEERAPDNDVDRRAVLEFFDAIARGNDQAMRSMLALTDQQEIEALVESGEWQRTAEQIQTLRLQTGVSKLGDKCVLAVIEVGVGAGTSYQPQLWYYQAEEDDITFEAVPTPPGILNRLSGDWIARWHEILEEELMLANKPDEEFVLAKRNLDESSSSEPGSSPSGPSEVPGMPQPQGPPLEVPRITP